MKKLNFFSTKTFTPCFMGYFTTVADFTQQQDKNSFDRVKLANLIPTIGGFPLTILAVV